MKKFLISVFVTLMIPLFCFAHPGHGSSDGYTITHYFIEPEHAMFTWSFFVAGLFLASFYKLKKRRSRK